MAKQFLGVYESMDFPPYVFQEYPKWVRKGTGPDGKPVEKLCKNQREEIAFLGDTSTDEVISEVVTNNAALEAEVAALRAQLAALQQTKALGLMDGSPINVPAAADDPIDALLKS